MLNIQKILLPIDFPNVSLSVVHQAAAVARQFHSEIVILHVMTQASHSAGVPDDGPARVGWDVLSEAVKSTQKKPGQSPEPDLDGIAVHNVLSNGNTANVIMQTAHKEKIDLIMMPSHGHTFSEFLLATSAIKATDGTECPIWTGTHNQELPVQTFAIRNILCAVNFTSHDPKTISWAARLAEEFSASLTLAHVTPAAESWGPGGNHAYSKCKNELIEDASEHLSKIQRGLSKKADVFIGSGDVCKTLAQAAVQKNADLLVTGCHPYGGHLRTHGYEVIRAMPVPVLNV